MPGSPIEILLVEDNPADIDLTIESFAESKVANRIHAVLDGEAAMDFLHRRGRYADAVTPDVVLLDLNLPKKDGREVLAEIKRDEVLKRIPVVILTSSQAERDIVESYQLHANCYISKPVGFGQFLEVVEAIQGFWFEVVKLPAGGGS